LSGIHDDLFTYEIENPTPCVKQTSDATNNNLESYEWKMSYEECKKIYAEAVILIDKRLVRLIDVTVEQYYKLQFEEYMEIKRQRDTYTREVDMEYYLFNLVFTEWLATKSYNHLDMDWYTKKALWVYWMRGDDEVILSNEEVSDLKDKNNNDEHEIAEIFRIETNLFDYETPLIPEIVMLGFNPALTIRILAHKLPSLVVEMCILAKPVGIKSFIRLFGITAALIKVSVAQEERVNVAGTKLQLLTELQLLMDKD
ncbi:hypothetical protein Tco_0497471, partial [Tanacetum coccineum]